MKQTKNLILCHLQETRVRLKMKEFKNYVITTISKIEEDFFNVNIDLKAKSITGDKAG